MKLPKAGNILTRPLFLVAAAAFLVTTFFPGIGLGPPLCGFYQLTDLPCFGCGMTRSLTFMAKMEVARAWQFHPFGPLAWPLMLIFGIAGIRRSWSQALTGFILKHDRVTSPIFWTVLAIFLLFGLFRMGFMDSYFGEPHRHIH